MKEFLSNLLDWIYKKKCYFCRDSKESLKMCSNCYSKMEYNNFTPIRSISDINIFSAGEYTNEMQKLIRGLKYHKQKELAFFLAKFMYEYFRDLKIEGKFQVVPVPLHKNRQKHRGYNHMELVAREFCNLSGYTINTTLIKRGKDTAPQYKLTYKQRLNNLSNAFEVDKSQLLDLPILIIDDICTTGATFQSMIEILKENGCINKIICFSASNPT